MFTPFTNPHPQDHSEQTVLMDLTVYIVVGPRVPPVAARELFYFTRRKFDNKTKLNPPVLVNGIAGKIIISANPTRRTKTSSIYIHTLLHQTMD